MDKIFARCPQCQSIFHISAAQNKVANNDVRCGQCGNVFNTKEHAHHAPILSNSENENSFLGHIELPEENHTTPWLKIVSSALIICLGLSGLIIQYFFFNAPQLSQKAEYRPKITQFCRVFGCDIPVYHKPALILAERLVVHVNPNLYDSLIIEFILTNTADYEQAYPKLSLHIHDQDNHKVAVREFSPEEYLPKNILIDSPIPTDKSVRVKIAILDPGQTAVSYVISITQ